MPLPSPPVRAIPLILIAPLVSVLLGSCGAPSSDALPPEQGGPLTNRGECDAPPAGTDATVEGLLAPPGTVITAVHKQGPTTQVQAYVPLTPIAIRRFYQDKERVEVLEIEDETVESEGLVSDSETGYRTLFKAEAVCNQGSEATFVVAKELEGELGGESRGEGSGSTQ